MNTKQNSEIVRLKGRRLSSALCRIMAERRWTKARLSEEIGVHIATVYRWLDGDGKPNLVYRRRIIELRKR